MLKHNLNEVPLQGTDSEAWGVHSCAWQDRIVITWAATDDCRCCSFLQKQQKVVTQLYICKLCVYESYILNTTENNVFTIYLCLCVHASWTLHLPKLYTLCSVQNASDHGKSVLLATCWSIFLSWYVAEQLLMSALRTQHVMTSVMPWRSWH